MAVRIRLRRMGRKKKPHYRVVVTDRAKPRDGRFVESLGHYQPLLSPARLVIDLERVDYWIAQGAVPSDTVSSLLSRARGGGDPDLAVGEIDPEAEKERKAAELAAKRKAEAELKAADAAAAAAETEAEEEAEVEEEPETDDDGETETDTAEEEVVEEETEAAAEAEGEEEAEDPEDEETDDDGDEETDDEKKD